MYVNKKIIMVSLLSSQSSLQASRVRDNCYHFFNLSTLETRISHHLMGDLPLLIHEPDTAHRLWRRARDVFRRVIFLQRSERLMEIAKRQILVNDETGSSFPNGQIWWAKSLTRAKGRMQRHWYADEGGIYLCIAIYPSLFQEDVHFYNIATGLSICQILREWGVDAHIRWLNDVLIEGKKVAGVLAETIVTPRLNEHYLLTGIGINVNQNAFPTEITQHSTSLLIETGRKWPIMELGTHIISRIALNFALLHEWQATSLSESYSTRPNPVIMAYKGLSNLIGRRIRFGTDLEKERGTAATVLDILPDGSLELLLADGTEAIINTGEIRYDTGS